MHYILDGYNILFRTLRKGGDLKTQRASFLAELNDKIKLLGMDVTLVFDAQYAEGDASRSFYDAVEVHFTDQGETADEYILKHVRRSSHPRQEVVVTSDARLAWAVRRQLVRTETVEKFLSSLNKRYESKLIKSVQERNAPPKEAVKEKISPPLPLPQKDPVDNFAYYLQSFEKRYEELSKSPEVPIKKKRPRKEKQPPQAPRLPGESEFDRWLRLFQSEEM